MRIPKRCHFLYLAVFYLKKKEKQRLGDWNNNRQKREIQKLMQRYIDIIKRGTYALQW